MKFILVILITLLCSACVVSKSSFDALEADKKRMEDSLNTALQSSNSQGTAYRDSLALARQKEQKLIKDSQSTLAEREARIREIESRLAARDSNLAQLRRTLNEALLGFMESGLSVDIRGDKVYVSLSDKLVFPSGSTDIDEKGKSALDNLAKVLNNQPDINIQVEGHTDNVPVVNLQGIKDNWDLSTMRSTQVVRYLTGEGKVVSKRVTASGRSEYSPIESNNSSTARARNRRIEIVLTPKLSELFDLINDSTVKSSNSAVASPAESKVVKPTGKSKSKSRSKKSK
jgi:chemotaxis protein MotB